jgi:hypothetical protein
MPDPDADERQSARLLTALVWGGVGLAPVAVLVALLGGSDASLRFALLLLAVAVVLIGASMLIRNDPVLLRHDMDDRVTQSAEMLREEMRDAIAAAARASHHRVQLLQDEIARLPGGPLPGAPMPGVPLPGAPVAGARPAGVPAQRTPGATSRPIPVTGAAAVARAVPVPSATAAVARAVPPAPAAAGRGRVQAPSPDDGPARRDSTPAHGGDGPGRRDSIPAHGGDGPRRRGEAPAESGGRRSRRRAAEDQPEPAPRRHASPDRYESERYGPDPQAGGRRSAPETPVEQGDWRDPADRSYDDYGRW